MIPLFSSDAATAVPEPEGDCRVGVQPYLDRAGMADAVWPLSVDDAARLLRDGFDYDVDPAELTRLGSLAQLPSIESWDAKDILAAGGALEARRQWLVHSPLHQPKMHQSARDLIALIEAGSAGDAELQRAFGPLDARLVLILLAEAGSREVRERLLTTAFFVLARDHHVAL